MMTKDDLEALKKCFVHSVPEIEDKQSAHSPSVTSEAKKFVVAFRRKMEPQWVEQFFCSLGIAEFRPLRDDISYVIESPQPGNGFQLLKQISHHHNVRYVGPYRMAN